MRILVIEDDKDVASFIRSGLLQAGCNVENVAYPQGTCAEAGAIASFSTRTLRRAIAGHKLQAHHVGRNVRIELAELRRWIEADGAAAVASSGVADPASDSGSGR